MTERRIKAVGTVTGANYGRLMRGGFTILDSITAFERMAKQRTAEARGQSLHVDDLVPSSVEAGKQAGIKDIDVLEATDYYRTPRGQKPNSRNRSLLSHQAAAVSRDAFHLAEMLLTQPLIWSSATRWGPSALIAMAARSSCQELALTRLGIARLPEHGIGSGDVGLGSDLTAGPSSARKKATRLPPALSRDRWTRAREWRARSHSDLRVFLPAASKCVVPEWTRVDSGGARNCEPTQIDARATKQFHWTRNFPARFCFPVTSGTDRP